MKQMLVLICVLFVACNGSMPTSEATQISQFALTSQEAGVADNSPTASDTHSLLMTFTPTQTEEPKPELTPTPSTTTTQEPEPTIFPTDTPEPPLPAGAIQWDEAKNHIGERLTVCGMVMDATFASSTNGQPTFINLGKGYPDPDRFSVLIWGKYRYKFSSPPESLYLKKDICVTGLIVSYKGQAEVEVNDSSQITFR
jgi:hypothetical protein